MTEKKERVIIELNKKESVETIPEVRTQRPKLNNIEDKQD
jgi:hypothetical protein